MITWAGDVNAGAEVISKLTKQDVSASREGNQYHFIVTLWIPVGLAECSVQFK